MEDPESFKLSCKDKYEKRKKNKKRDTWYGDGNRWLKIGIDDRKAATKILKKRYKSGHHSHRKEIKEGIKKGAIDAGQEIPDMIKTHSLKK
jgi:hypothetical protein